MNKIAKIVLLCILADSFNLVFSYVFYDILHIPLFMDTIFTVALTFYCGLVPGLITAVMYNVLSVFIRLARIGEFQPIMMLFGICSAIVSLVTWFFARQKGEFKISFSITLLYLLLISVLSSFFVVLSSGVIDFIRLSYFDNPNMVTPIREFTDSFRFQKFSLFASCIFGQIPVSITDRIITTFLGFFVYRLMVKAFGEESWR